MDEVVDEVVVVEEAVVDSEEDEDEAVEEDFKDWVEWMAGRWDDHYTGNGDKIRIWKEEDYYEDVRSNWLYGLEMDQEKESALHAQLVGILAF